MATVAALLLTRQESWTRRGPLLRRRVCGHGASTWFDHLGLHRLIALVPDPVELRSFAVDVLGPLAGTGQEAVDLRETMQVAKRRGRPSAEPSVTDGCRA